MPKFTAHYCSMNFKEYNNSRGEILYYLGSPNLDLLEKLSLGYGDIWHSSFEQGYKNVFKDIVYQVQVFYWYVNDFDNLDQCVSWRLNPYLFAVRKSVWELLGGFDKEYRNPEIAALDFAYNALAYQAAIPMYVKGLYTETISKPITISTKDRYVFYRKNFKMEQHYNEDTRRLESLPGDSLNGFYRVSNYSASLALSTKLYGMYKPIFAKKKEIQIRHVFTPQVSLSGAPGFGKYWEEYTDYNGNTQYYSPFTNQPYGVPSREGSGTVSFSIANNLEMKYYDAKNDTVKKVSLIDDLSANMSYNMAAKERPWSDLNINLRLKLTKS